MAYLSSDSGRTSLRTVPCELIEKRDHTPKEVSGTQQTEAAEKLGIGKHDENVHTPFTHAIRDRAVLTGNIARY